MVEFFEALAFTARIIATLLFLVIVAGAAYGIVKMTIEIVKVNRRLKEAKRLRESYDVISVEAEITDIKTKRWNPMDVQYSVTLSYSVGETSYGKKITLHNKQSLRIGQVLILLCDSDHPEIAVLQNGAEEESIKSLTFALIIDVIIVIYGVASEYYRYKNG